MKKAFTLAEVLITLVIIGIVAAMTIPSLMVQLDKVVKANQIKVFESKLQKGMDRMNLAGEIGPYYQTTEDFIKALSAHMRIVTICKAGELQNCLPYKNIRVPNSDKPVKLEDISNGKNFGLNSNDFKDVAGMVLADGTPMILSWNTNCPVSDPDSSTRDSSITGDEEAIQTTACIKGIYDLNGVKGPNYFTKDVVSYNGVATLDNGALNIAGVKITGVYYFKTPARYQECVDNTANIELPESFVCIGDHPRRGWGNNSQYSAAKLCGGYSHIITFDQLNTLAKALYTRNDGTPFPGMEKQYGYANLIYLQNSEYAKELESIGFQLNRLTMAVDDGCNRKTFETNRISGESCPRENLQVICVE